MARYKYESMRDKWGRQASERASAPRSLEFRGASLVSGKELEARDTQKRSLETLAAQSEQDRLTQDNAASITQSAKNQLDVDAIHAEQAGPSIAKKRNEFMSMYSELSRSHLDSKGNALFDEEGNERQPLSRDQIIQSINDRNDAFKQFQGGGPSRPGKIPGQAVIEKESGDQEFYDGGMKGISTKPSRKIKEVLKRPYDTNHETRKRGPLKSVGSPAAITPVASAPVAENRSLQTYNSFKRPVDERLAPTKDIYRSFMKSVGTPAGEALTKSVKRKQRKSVFNFNNNQRGLKTPFKIRSLEEILAGRPTRGI